MKKMKYEAPLTYCLTVEIESCLCAGSKDEINNAGNGNLSIEDQEGEEDFVIGSWD